MCATTYAAANPSVTMLLARTAPTSPCCAIVDCPAIVSVADTPLLGTLAILSMVSTVVTTMAVGTVAGMPLSGTHVIHVVNFTVVSATVVEGAPGAAAGQPPRFGCPSPLPLLHTPLQTPHCRHILHSKQHVDAAAALWRGILGGV